MGAQGKGAGAPPWYGTKHHLMVSEELAARTTGDRWPRHHPYIETEILRGMVRSEVLLPSPNNFGTQRVIKHFSKLKRSLVDLFDR